MKSLIMHSREQCLHILGLDASAGPNAIKKAYRKLAFELHPDLNPNLPNAHRRFQELNEAYVLLMQEFANTSYTSRGSPGQPGVTRPQDGSARAQGSGGGSGKTRAEAQKAYSQAKAKFNAQANRQSYQARSHGASIHREELLRDLLNDPFARRVFEDIYSHVQHNAGEQENPPPFRRRAVAKPANKPSAIMKAGSKLASLGASLTRWIRRQIDDEQIIYLPGESLHPGARVRLQVSHGLGGESRIIELSLPPEFKIGRPIRLKGMGKRVGNVKGDLYLRVYSRNDSEAE